VFLLFFSVPRETKDVPTRGTCRVARTHIWGLNWPAIEKNALPDPCRRFSIKAESQQTIIDRTVPKRSEFMDVRANCFCASSPRTQIHTPRHTSMSALSNKITNDKADDHCYSFAWI